LDDYKTVSKDGITAAILHGNRVLLVKRRSFPTMTHKGLWSFVSGATKQGESYTDAAYREIEEETRIKNQDLELLAKDVDIIIFDIKKRIKWANKFFIFKSKTENVRLNFENSEYKWVDVKELEEHANTTLDYLDGKEGILDMIKSFAG
jgi:ADP-ribose pyrophosphatase YjhB (NUDIX family)